MPDFQKAVPKVVSDFGPKFAEFERVEGPEGFDGFGGVCGDSGDTEMILRFWEGLKRFLEDLEGFGGGSVDLERFGGFCGFVMCF